LDADAVVEIPARIDREGAHPLATDPLAPELLGLVAHVKAYERLAVRAAETGDRRDAAIALLANPLVGRYPLAEELTEALLEANRAHLPRFFAPAMQARERGAPAPGGVRRASA
jgi:6-phospho-beta-glucosidase